jgi:hypothetical protein
MAPFLPERGETPISSIRAAIQSSANEQIWNCQVTYLKVLESRAVNQTTGTYGAATRCVLGVLR